MCAENDSRRPINGILDGLAESVAHEDSDELLKEARAAGESPELIAKKLKGIALAALKKFEQRKLEAARKAYVPDSRSDARKDPGPDPPASALLMKDWPAMQPTWERKTPTNGEAARRPYCAKHHRAKIDIGGEKKCPDCMKEKDVRRRSNE